MILESVQNAFARLTANEPVLETKNQSAVWLRWDQGQFDRARLYLEANRATDYTLDDWMLVVDLLIHRYLPPGVIKTEADYLAMRAALLSKIEANQARVNAAPHLEEIVELVPTSFARSPARILTAIERATLQFAKARAGDSIVGVTERTRHAMKGIIVEHVQAKVLGQKEGTVAYLRQRLFDSFGALNLDFYEIAVSEMGECSNQGFVASQAPGAKVRRVEAYQGACEFCQSINGKVFEVVPADAPHKNGLTQVWVGKTNVGRLPPGHKTVDGIMADRQESEAWWPAAGLQHPNCRGSWLSVSGKPSGVGQEFEDWLQALVQKDSRFRANRFTHF